MAETTQRSLLLVEDDVVIAYAEQRRLKEYGYKVNHVLSGRDAVDIALSGESEPDLILMDINLGEGMMDGTEAARLILEKKDIPVVFLSSHTEPEIVAKTESITSYGYVVKDSGITVLDASIKMAFRLFESRQREKRMDRAFQVLREYLDGRADINDSLFRMKTKSGGYRWIFGKGKAVWDEEGTPVRMAGTNTDVTDAYRAKALLIESEESFRLVFDNAKEGILIAEFESARISYANPQACRLFGYTPEEFGTMTFSDLHDTGLFPDDCPIQGRCIERKGKIENIPCKRKDGTIFYCNTASGECRSGENLYSIAYFYDLTERRELERALEREKTFFSEGPVSSFVWLPRTGWPVSYVSGNISEILGYGADELMSEDLLYADLIHPGDQERVRKEVAFNTAMGEDCFDQSYRIRHKGGHFLWVLDFTRLRRDEEGRVCEILGYMFDQSRLKEAEDEVVRQKERLSGIIAGTNLGTWEWNLVTNEVIINEQWAAMLGYTREELGAMDEDVWISLTHKDDVAVSDSCIKDHLEGRTDYYSCEVRMRHKNGTWLWILGKGKVTEWTEEGEPLWIFGTQQDITERKENEKAIQQQLEEKEILLREVHHRIKNNMNSISSLLKLQAGMDDADDSGAIHKAIGRLEGMRVLYEKLLLSDEYKEIAVKPYAEELIRSIEDIFPEKKSIRIETSIDDLQMNTKKIFPLGLILNELITNSMKYAFELWGEGRINVDLSRYENGEVVLTVFDNGKGLPPGFDLDSDPGFGLKLVRMLAKQLGGVMKIETRGGVCTEIRCCGHEE